MKSFKPRLALVWLACFAISARAAAETKVETPMVRVGGEAVLYEAPDRAEIEIGVVTTAKRAPDASGENARKVRGVLEALKKTLGAKADLRTAGYSLTANQHFPERGGTPTITGYTAANVVEVRIDDLEKIGTAIDTAMEAGANQIQGLRLTIRDETGVRERALVQATKQARGKAEALADALGVKLGKVLSIEEAAGGGPPIPMRAMAVAGDARTTPVESGTIEVRASVSLAIEIER
ncbi:MAG: SIMPL domain-containing protein [Candidatus Binatia bacterium]